jgi:hypothetical protein
MSMSRTTHRRSSVKLMVTAVIGAAALVAVPASVAAADDAGPAQLNSGAVGFINATGEMSPAAGTANYGAGSAVAISGSVAVVGSPSANVVDVFDKTSKGWTDVTPTGLTGTDTSAGDQFGASVAISGSEIAIGAPMNAGQGAVYVFTKTSKGWNQTGEVIGADTATGDNFGTSVGISSSTLAVGAPMNAAQGAAYVFTHQGANWNQTGEFIGNDTTSGDNFGRSLSLSGSSILVGAPRHQVVNVQQGAGYIFTKGTKGWAQSGEIAAPDGGAFDHFGVSVALVGTAAVIGSPQHTLSGSAQVGAVYAATHGSKGWAVIGELTSPDGVAHDSFGNSVGLSSSGILVGAPNHPVGGSAAQGSAYLFTKSGANYNVSGEFIAADGATNDRAGTAIAVSGSEGIVGAPGNAFGGNALQGVAYVVPV